MMNKILYHGGFAALGLSLLLGMAALQVNGRKTSEDILALNEPAPTSFDTTLPVPQNDAAAPVAETAMAPAPVESVSQSVMESKPVVKTAKRVPSPVLKEVREKIEKVEMDTVQSFSIFDSARKSTTKKIFGTSPNAIRGALGYFNKIGAKRAVIKAQVPDGHWATISSSAFKKYASDAVGD